MFYRHPIRRLFGGNDYFLNYISIKRNSYILCRIGLIYQEI